MISMARGVDTGRSSKTRLPCAGGPFGRGWTMVKETKFFRKQADKAERMARSANDGEVTERYLNLARAYRTQAEVLKAKKKAAKKAR
jgi:hypothetical protein